MTTDELRRLYSAQPFRPFRILTADGRHYDVSHPERLNILGNGRLINVAMRDHFVTIDLLLVTGVQQPIRRGKRGSNGSPKKPA
jgi:hypothetical protein